MFVIFGGGRFGLRRKIFTSFIGNESSSLPIREKYTPVLILTLPHFISDHQVCGVFFHTSSNSLGGCVCLCVCMSVCVCVCVHECTCSVTQSSLTLCDPRDCSPLGSSVLGVFQVRTLEWVAIISSRGSS